VLIRLSSLADSAACQRSLPIVDFASFIKVGDSGAAAISEALNVNNTVKRLGSSYNKRLFLSTWKCNREDSGLVTALALLSSTMCQGRAKEDLYTVLNVSQTASINEIKKAYRQAALFAHPDKGGNVDRFHEISYAFEVLSCSAARHAYDKQHYIFQAERQATAPSGDTLHPRWGARSARGRSFSSRFARFFAKKAGLKRAAPESGIERPCAKRCCTGLARRSVATLETSCENLRITLQSFTALKRECHVRSLPITVRAMLLKYMEKRAKLQTAVVLADGQTRASTQSSKHNRLRKSAAPCTNVRTIAGNYGNKFKAQLHFKTLRIYTSAQTSLEAAIEHQMILTQIRQAIAAAISRDDAIVDRPAELYELCTDIFEKNRTTESTLGLRALIHMRASKWLGNNCYVITPVMSLKDALRVQTAFVNANRTSWDALRSVWIQTLKQRTGANHNGQPVSQLVVAADRAWAARSQEHLRLAIRRVQRAIDKEKRRTFLAARAKAQQIRQEQRTAARIQQIEAAKVRKLRSERLKWCCGNLTMEEIVRGPPSTIRIPSV